MCWAAANIYFGIPPTFSLSFTWCWSLSLTSGYSTLSQISRVWLRSQQAQYTQSAPHNSIQLLKDQCGNKYAVRRWSYGTCTSLFSYFIYMAWDKHACCSDDCSACSISGDWLCMECRDPLPAVSCAKHLMMRPSKVHFVEFDFVENWECSSTLLLKRTTLFTWKTTTLIKLYTIIPQFAEQHLFLDNMTFLLDAKFP